MSKKSDLSKLQKHERDLTDDMNDITAINKDVNNLIEDFQKAIKSDNTASIIDKMDDLREVYEYNDTNIAHARSNIEDEIRELEREIEEEESRKAAK